MRYHVPFSIQQWNENDETWIDYISLHGRVNKTNGAEYFKVGASKSTATLSFEFRYNPKIKDIYINTQLFRVIYDGVIYNILDYDDFFMKHKKCKLVCVSNGEY